jgi:hypothetical protein
MTAINVGLNRVQLRLLGDQWLEYVVTYRRWAAYAVALGAAIGAALIACFLLIPDVRRDIAAHEGGAVIFWGSVVFWGFLWPWLFIPLHKRSARQGLIHIIDQVDTQADRM